MLIVAPTTGVSVPFTIRVSNRIFSGAGMQGGVVVVAGIGLEPGVVVAVGPGVGQGHVPLRQQGSRVVVIGVVVDPDVVVVSWSGDLEVVVVSGRGTLGQVGISCGPGGRLVSPQDAVQMFSPYLWLYD